MTEHFSDPTNSPEEVNWVDLDTPPAAVTPATVLSPVDEPEIIAPPSPTSPTKHRKTLVVVETAFLASTASLIWLINYYFPIGPLLRLFFPLPIALVYLRWGSRAAWMSTLVSGLLLSILMGPTRSIIYTIPYGLIGVQLGWLWRRQGSWYWSIALGTILGTLGFFFRVWLLDVRVQNQPQDLAIAFPKLTQLQPTLVQAKSTAPPAKTQMPRLRGQAPASSPSNRLLLMAIGAFCLLGISGLLWQQWRRSSTREATPPATPPLINPVPITDAPEPSSPVTLPGGELETEPIALTKNQILQLQDEANLTAATIPGATVPDTLVIPGGSILRVEEITADFQVMLKLCRSSAQTIPANSQPLTEGNNGWVALTDLEGQLVEDFVVPAVNPCGPEVE